MAEQMTLEQVNDRLNILTSASARVTPQTDAFGLTRSEVALVSSGLLLVFALVVLAAVLWLVRQGRSPSALLKLVGPILVVVLAVFLVVAGFSDQQIAPVIGLLGTVVGYVMGREPRAGDDDHKAP